MLNKMKWRKIGVTLVTLLVVASIFILQAGVLKADRPSDLRAQEDSVPSDSWKLPPTDLGDSSAERCLHVPCRERAEGLTSTMAGSLGKLPSLQSQSASSSGWKTVGSGDYVQRLVRYGDTLIESSLGGGAIFWNLKDGSYTQYLYPQDGIGDNWVYETVRDDNGVFWAAHLGVDTGLSKQSGGVWQVFTPALGINHRCQTVSSYKSSIIVGTANEVLRYDQITGEWTALYSDSAVVNWSDTVVDRTGTVWAATLTEGGLFSGGKGNILAISPDGELTPYKTNLEGHPDSVYFLNLAPDGRLWISTPHYLAISTEPTPNIGGFTLFNDEFDHQELGDVRWDKEGNAWVGTTGGLYLWTKKASKPVRYAGIEKGIPHAFTLELSSDEKTIFVGTQGEGIKVFDIEQRQVVGELRTKGLKGSPTCAVTDPYGNLWLGTRDEGLNVISKGGEWLYFKDSLSSPKVNNLAVTSSKANRYQLAIATSRGLTIADITVPWSLNKRPEKLPFVKLVNTTYVDVSGYGLDRSVASVSYDAKGRLWFSTRSGIGKVENGKVFCWPTGYLAGPLSVDSAGEIQVGSLTGVQIFSPETLSWKQKEEIPKEYVRAISLSDMESWYAVMSKGIYVLSGGKLVRYSRETEGWNLGLDYSLGIALLGNDAYAASSSWGLSHRDSEGNWERVGQYCHFDCTWVYTDPKSDCVYAGGDSLAPCPAFSVKGCGDRFSNK